MTYFDFESAAREAGVSNDLLHRWLLGFTREYGGDEMMVELRLLRACNAAAASSEALTRVADALEAEFATGSEVLSTKLAHG